MVRKRFVSRAKAAEFDIGALLNAESVKQGFLCMSASTWELCYQLVQFYGDWRSRYYWQDEATGEQFEITDEEYNQVRDITQAALEELQMSGCEDLVSAVDNLTAQVGLINTSIQLSASIDGCCTPYGGIPPQTAPDLGDIVQNNQRPADFRDWTEYLGYKCNVANAIFDDYRATLAGFGTLSGAVAGISTIALAAFLQTSLLGGLLVGLMAVGFSAGAAAAIIIAALVGLVVGGTGLLAYFANVATQLDALQAQIVCSLFLSNSVQEAKSVMTDNTTTAADAVTYSAGDDLLFKPALSGIAEAIFNTSVLNKLFERDEAYISRTNTIDCADCSQILWEYLTDAEGWTWADVSVLGATAVGSWQDIGATGNGVLQNAIIVPTTANADGRILWTSPELLVDVAPGCIFRINHNAPSDGILTGYNLRIRYTDLTEDVGNSTSTIAESTQVVGTQAKTVKELLIEIGRGNSESPGPGYNFTTNVRAAVFQW